MIRGAVRNLVPVIPLTIIDGASDLRRFHVAVDTGFSGSLTLPPGTIRDLGLPFVKYTSVTLANGGQEACGVYLASIDWHESRRQVEALELGDQPLVGMALLKDSKVTFVVREGDPVTIEPL